MSGKSVYFFVCLKWGGKKDHIFKARNIGTGPTSEYYLNSKTFNNLLWLSLI